MSECEHKNQELMTLNMLYCSDCDHWLIEGKWVKHDGPLKKYTNIDDLLSD